MPLLLHMPPSCSHFKTNDIRGIAPVHILHGCIRARSAGTESCLGAHSASENAFDRSLRAPLFVSAKRDNLHEQPPMQFMLSRLWAFVYVVDCVHAHAVYIRWWYIFMLLFFQWWRRALTSFLECRGKPLRCNPELGGRFVDLFWRSTRTRVRTRKHTNHALGMHADICKKT